MAALDQQTASRITDILSTPSEKDKYTSLRSRLLGTFCLGKLVSKISPSTCYGLASNAYLNRKTERHMWHAIDLTPITALEISFNWLHPTYWPFIKPLSLFWNIRSVIYRVRAFLKHLPKNNSAILTNCDYVSILRFRYMLRSNPVGPT